MFTAQQVKQFKEAFNMIDQDGDGRVTESDLQVMLSELGMSNFFRSASSVSMTGRIVSGPWPLR